MDCITNVNVPQLLTEPCGNVYISTLCTISPNANATLDLPADSTQAEVNDALTAALIYKEQQIVALQALIDALTVNVSDKTTGAVTADDVSLYQVLTYDLNVVDTTGIADKVVLPTTTVIGKEVLVFAANNANTFAVRGNQAGTAVLSPNGVSSQSTNVSIAANISYRFIHLGGGYWKAELI